MIQKGSEEMDESEEMIEAVRSKRDRRREALPDSVAAEGLPDITRVEELMTREQVGQELRDNLRQKVEERKASAPSSSPTQSVPIKSSQPAIPKIPPPPKTPPKTPPQRGRANSKEQASSRAKPTPPSPP